MEVPPGQEHLYGIVAGEPRADAPRTMHVDDMVEKPAPGTAPSRLAIIGRYVLPAEIWPILARHQARQGRRDPAHRRAQDARAARARAATGSRVDGKRHDAGDKLGYLGANLAYALKRDELRARPAAR